MALTVMVINQFCSLQLKKGKRQYKIDTEHQLIKLYQNAHLSQALPTDVPMISYWQQLFLKGARLYLGIEKEQIIAAVGSHPIPQANTVKLQYLAVHHTVQHRNMAAKLLYQVILLEKKYGTQSFIPQDAYIHQLLVEYEWI